MLLAVQRQVRCWFVRRREFGCGVAVFSCRHAGFLAGAEHLWTVLQQNVVDPKYAHRVAPT